MVLKIISVLGLLSLCFAYDFEDSRSTTLVRVYVSDRQEQRFLANFFDFIGFTVDTHAKSIDVAVTTELFTPIVAYLQDRAFKFKIINNLLEADILEERYGDSLSRSSNSGASKHISFDRFHNLSTIYDYLNKLASLYHHRVKLDIIGKTYEGREILTITISNGYSSKNQSVILIDSGIHAREWLSHQTSLYIIAQLVENFDQNQVLFKDTFWVITPVVNPDGYVYTHESDRLWRKNRSPGSGNCYGVDLNRNFDVHWGEVLVSKNPCSQIYYGTAPFSEAETKAIRDLMLFFQYQTKLYINLHSYGSVILYPWGHSKTPPKNVKALEDIAKTGAEKIKKETGDVWKYFNSGSKPRFAASGCADDYALAKTAIPLAFTMELPEGADGFILNRNESLPNLEKAWMAIKAMALKVIFEY